MFLVFRHLFGFLRHLCIDMSHDALSFQPSFLFNISKFVIPPVSSPCTTQVLCKHGEPQEWFLQSLPQGKDCSVQTLFWHFDFAGTVHSTSWWLRNIVLNSRKFSTDAFQRPIKRHRTTSMCSVRSSFLHLFNHLFCSMFCVFQSTSSPPRTWQHCESLFPSDPCFAGSRLSMMTAELLGSSATAFWCATQPDCLRSATSVAAVLSSVVLRPVRRLLPPRRPRYKNYT